MNTEAILEADVLEAIVEICWVSWCLHHAIRLIGASIHFAALGLIYRRVRYRSENLHDYTFLKRRAGKKGSADEVRAGSGTLVTNLLCLNSSGLVCNLKPPP